MYLGACKNLELDLLITRGVNYNFLKFCFEFFTKQPVVRYLFFVNYFTVKKSPENFLIKKKSLENVGKISGMCLDLFSKINGVALHDI